MMKIAKKLLVSCAFFFMPINMQAALPKNLTEITRPYLGVYECEQLLFDGKDLLDDFKYIKIELKSDGEMLVHFSDKQGKKSSVSARYEYDEQVELLTVSTQMGTKTIKRSFPLKNGELYVHITYETKTLSMKFVQNG